MMVWVYPEKKMERFGATRWVVEWWTVRRGAEGKEEIDFDSDLVTRAVACPTKDAAMKRAKKVAAESYFGSATVEEQRVDWFVEEDRVAEWSGVGSVEEVMAE